MSQLIDDEEAALKMTGLGSINQLHAKLVTKEECKMASELMYFDLLK